MLAPFFNGCIAMIDGIQTQMFSGIVGPNATNNSGWSYSNTTDGYGQLPISGNGLASSYTAFNETFVAFRPLVAAVDCFFTGTSYEDSGSVTVSTVSNQLMPRGSKTIDALVDYTLDNFDGTTAGNTGSASSMANAVTIPARQALRARVTPACPSYQTTTWINLQDNDTKPLGLYAHTTSTFPDGIPASPYSTCCPWKVIAYSGLAQSASITVSVRYSCQYVVDDSSSFAPLAAPSAPPDTSTRSFIERIAASIPTAEIADMAVSGVIGAARNFLSRAAMSGPRRKVRDEF